MSGKGLFTNLKVSGHVYSRFLGESQLGHQEVASDRGFLIKFAL